MLAEIDVGHREAARVFNTERFLKLDGGPGYGEAAGRQAITQASTRIAVRNIP